MCLLCLELRHDEGNKAVLVIRHVHHIKVLTEEILDSFHLDSGYDLTLGNAGFTDLTLLAEHVREFRVIRLDRCAAVLDGDFLLVDEQGDNRSNVDLAPAIRNALIAALNIKHGGGQLCSILNDQVFLNLGCRVTIGFCAGDKVAIQDLNDICIRLSILLNQAKLTVDMSDQILQRLINAGLRITALDFNVLTVHIEGRTRDSFFQIFHSGQFISASLVLLVADDVLHGLRKLGDIALLHEFTDLHCTLQCLIVGGAGKHDDSLPLGFRHKAQLRFFYGIGCDR